MRKDPAGSRRNHWRKISITRLRCVVIWAEETSWETEPSSTHYGASARKPQLYPAVSPDGQTTCLQLNLLKDVSPLSSEAQAPGNIPICYMCTAMGGGLYPQKVCAVVLTSCPIGFPRGSKVEIFWSTVIWEDKGPLYSREYTTHIMNTNKNLNLHKISKNH